MKKSRFLLLVVGSVVMALMIAAFAGTGTSVGQDAYFEDVGAVTVVPSAACPGDSITLSGGGLSQNMAVNIRMTTAADRELPLGQATADAAGKWSLTTTVPLTEVSPKDGSRVPIGAGAWNVWAVATAASANVNFTAQGTLTVLDCAGPLPATGFSLTTIAYLGTALLLVLLFGLLSWRRTI